MKLLIVQFSPTSCHFISPRSKYSPQHPVLNFAYRNYETNSELISYLILRSHSIFIHK
jgi:hypothetical protein